MKKKYLLVGGTILVAIFVITSLVPTPTPEDVCIDAFTSKFGEEFKNPMVKDKTWNSVSYDIGGYYSGGAWTCALSNNPVEFQSGQLLPTNSKMTWFSSEELSGN